MLNRELICVVQIKISKKLSVQQIATDYTETTGIDLKNSELSIAVSSNNIIL